MLYGLTGGMGAGKSVVATILREHGYQVLDADAISREVMQKNSPLLRLLVRDFGIEIINEDGTCNRRKLGELAFADKDKTRRLNSVVQSAILVRAIEKVHRMRINQTNDVVFFDVPLLFEAGWDSYVDQVWLVTAPEEVRVSRVMERDGLTEDEIITRINLQMPEDEKRARADVIIENNGNIEELEAKVEKLLSEL